MSKVNLNKLKVSLTKHGAHKVAPLLRLHGASKVLAKVTGSNINIDAGQARKTLSAERGRVPAVWDKAKALGNDALDALTLVGIIFSHHKLISTMKAGRDSSQTYIGSLTRHKPLDSKEFTNIAHIIEQLGYQKNASLDNVEYNFAKLFSIPGLNTLVLELLGLKLKTAGWDQTTELLDEIAAHNFHEVFSVPKDFFIDWLTTTDGHVEIQGILPEDLDFFTDTSHGSTASKPFHFKKGHAPKKTGEVSVSPSRKDIKAELLHNQMQTELFKKLVLTYGEDNVGTEVDTGDGTAIDLVVKSENSYWFYEIKTADNAKACIRQAIPQLLEYAYWQCKEDRATKLVIIGPHAAPQQAHDYLAYLKEKFNLPFEYQQFTTP